MAPHHWKLEYPEESKHPGEWISAPPLIDSFKLRLVIDDLRSAIAGLPIHPPDMEHEGGRLDEWIYQEYRGYILEIAKLLRPFRGMSDKDVADWLAEFDPQSRHELFVCTEPVAHWRDRETQLPGLSGVEQLLGYSYPTSDSSSTFSPPSGDEDSYLIAGLCLNFRNIGLELAREFPAAFLQKIMEDAAYLSDPDRSKTDGGGSNSAPIQEPLIVDKQFEESKHDVADELTGLGVSLPSGF